MTDSNQRERIDKLFSEWADTWPEPPAFPTLQDAFAAGAVSALREGADAAPQCYCDRLREEAIAAGRDEFHACYVCAPEAGTMLAILPTAPADAASPPDRLWAWTTPEGRVTAVLAAKAEPPFVEYTRAAPREDTLAALRARANAGADRLALAVLRCVDNGALDARSGPADALLDYGDARFDVRDGSGIQRLRALAEAPEAPREEEPIYNANEPDPEAEADPSLSDEAWTEFRAQMDAEAPPAGQEVRGGRLHHFNRHGICVRCGLFGDAVLDEQGRLKPCAALAASPAGQGEGAEREPSVHAAFGEWFIRGGTADSRAFAAGWEAALRSAPTGTREPRYVRADLEAIVSCYAGKDGAPDAVDAIFAAYDVRPLSPPATEARDG